MTPNIDPQIVEIPYNKDPNKVPPPYFRKPPSRASELQGFRDFGFGLWGVVACELLQSKRVMK